MVRRVELFRFTVIGRRFLLGDVVLNLIDPIPDYGSGVQLIGIGEIGAYDLADAMYRQRFLKSYHLTGMLGQASSNGLATGPLMYRSPWRHITRPKLDRILASIEFKARSALMLQAGLVPNTHKAYEALSNLNPKEVVLKPHVEPCESLPPDHVTPYWDRRPEPTQPHCLRSSQDQSSLPQFPPSIHGIRCINFAPPFFTLGMTEFCIPLIHLTITQLRYVLSEIKVLNETEEFLTDLMVNIGASLRSSCVLSCARRIRHGLITVHDSLLLKQCVVPHSLYERFVHLRSKPPEREFANEDEYRRHVLSELIVDEETNLFSNLVKCTPCYQF
ncbi:unnamed protein product [Hydatigera taeniaeformis]|uniref:Glutamate--cysteine ligase n=1 Tax=Hydatigena taeniaeformis TaxID=6205 RepID=A0A0R3WK08_HYDTA|nr:unnamed protein product [Hydatigera taeniaeformis]